MISAEQEFDSAATSINSSKLPAVYNMVKFNPGDVVVDFGGGKFDNAVNYLKDQDVTLLVYDPYNRSAEHNKYVLRVLKEHGGADAAVNSNVLNVIKETEARNAVLQNIKKITKKGAPIYITVYEGTGKGNEGPTKSGYQLNRKTSDYMDEISQVFSNVKRKGKLITAINESLTEDDKSTAFNDKYFPRVDINNTSRYDTAEFKDKFFAYDKKNNVLIYLFKDDEEVSEMGWDNAPWRELDSAGLSSDNWNDEEARNDYLYQYNFDLDSESSYLAQDFIDNELPYYQNKNESLNKSLNEVTQLKLFDDDMINDIEVLYMWRPEEVEKILIKHGSNPNSDTWITGLDLPAAYDEIMSTFRDKYSDDDEIDYDAAKVLGLVEESLKESLNLNEAKNIINVLNKNLRVRFKHSAGGIFSLDRTPFNEDTFNKLIKNNYKMIGDILEEQGLKYDISEDAYISKDANLYVTIYGDTGTVIVQFDEMESESLKESVNSDIVSMIKKQFPKATIKTSVRKHSDVHKSNPDTPVGKTKYVYIRITPDSASSVNSILQYCNHNIKKVLDSDSRFDYYGDVPARKPRGGEEVILSYQDYSGLSADEYNSLLGESLKESTSGPKYVTRDIINKTNSKKLKTAYDKGELEVLINGDVWYTERCPKGLGKELKSEMKRLYPDIKYLYGESVGKSSTLSKSIKEDYSDEVVTLSRYLDVEVPDICREVLDLIEHLPSHKISYATKICRDFYTNMENIIKNYTMTGDNLKESSYGGAFDIADDEYFTKEDGMIAANEVAYQLEKEFPEAKLEVMDMQLDNHSFYVVLTDKDGNEFTEEITLDMRKIRHPLDLIKKYAPALTERFIKQIKDYYSEM